MEVEEKKRFITGFGFSDVDLQDSFTHLVQETGIDSYEFISFIRLKFNEQLAEEN